jgi:DNA-binding transcriptional MerR regulator
LFYKAKHVRFLYDITDQSITDWVNRFSAFLSVDSQAGKGRHRQFRQEDLAVFSLIKAMRTEGFQFESIFASLKSGERGEVTSLAPDEVEQLVQGAKGGGAIQRKISELENTLAQARRELERVETLNHENTTLRSELQVAQARIGFEQEEKARLNDRIQALTNQLVELSQKAGQEYARGYVEGMTQQAPKPKKPDEQA